MATKVAERPAETLAAARERVRELEHEEAALAGRLAEASRAGDEQGVAAVLTRRAMLPHLLARARREAAACELLVLDGQADEARREEARAREAATEADAARLAAWEAAREAERAWNVACAYIRPPLARLEDIARRSAALRRIIDTLDAPDPPPAA